jgi:hypothetical protein
MPAPLPNQGDVFFDRGRPDRALRLSRHPDAGVIVLSIWNGGVCQGTFRLATDQVGMFAEALLNAPGATPVVETGERQPSMYVTGQYETAPTIP